MQTAQVAAVTITWLTFLLNCSAEMQMMRAFGYIPEPYDVVGIR